MTPAHIDSERTPNMVNYVASDPSRDGLGSRSPSTSHDIANEMPPISRLQGMQNKLVSSVMLSHSPSIGTHFINSGHITQENSIEMYS